jgi:hypothetical protein
MCKRPSYLLLATATTSLYHKISIVRKYLLKNIWMLLDVTGTGFGSLYPPIMRLNAMNINRQNCRGF